jgi:DNA-binding response OmpR family regulator
MNRIAIIEDQERLCELIGKALARAGIESDAFVTIDSAWHSLQRTPYAMLIADRGLPDGDGLSLVRRLRNSLHPIPCLMLTARDALHDRIEGLEAGADDYLVKPFSMDELIARVRALMRRPATIRSLSPIFGDIQILPDRGILACGVGSVTLAPAELQIALALVEAGGKTVGRRSLEAAAWSINEAVTPNALDVAIHRLRKKFGAIGSSLEIANTRGFGYALTETPPP